MSTQGITGTLRPRQSIHAQHRRKSTVIVGTNNKGGKTKVGPLLDIPLEGKDSILHYSPSTTTKPFIPEPEQFDNAPEIAHLKIVRSSNQESADDEKESCIWTCIDCWDRWVGKVKNIGNLTVSQEPLDDLDPVEPRTTHSLEYIRKLADVPAKSPMGGSQLSHLSHKSMMSEDKDGKTGGMLKKRAYKSALDGLSQLHSANHFYKQMVLMLTFSRYAETPLTKVDLELTRSRSVLGSYIWLAVFILQQMQFDCDVTTSGYPANDAQEIVHAIEAMVSKSVLAWNATVRTIEHVEQIHDKVRKTFTTLSAKITHNKFRLKEDRHIRVHKKYDRRAEELQKMKEVEGPRRSIHAKFSLSPLRILYKNEKSRDPTWKGFDMLTSEHKFHMIKMIIHDATLILTTCIELFGKIQVCLRGKAGGLAAGGPSAPPCFEEGVANMGKYLEQVDGAAWAHQEIEDFIEVEKITMDNLDLLTVGTATLRGLLLDARHIIHICYETARDMDYMECRVMNSYETVVYNSLQDVNDDWKPTLYSKGDKKKRSLYDIEEKGLEKEDAESHFERSVFQDIIKEIPVFVNNLTIAFTLQDAEAAFSDSSHEMLSASVLHV